MQGRGEPGVKGIHPGPHFVVVGILDLNDFKATSYRNKELMT